jgi:hypothetical protein
MTLELLGGLLGLAALDALNPATIAGVALLLLAPIARPHASAAAFVIGAYLTVLAVGTIALLAAGAAFDGVSAGLEWLRRLAFGVAAVLVLRAASRRLRTWTRPAVRLPQWVSPASAGPLGVLMTGADLPNAFPYLIAIERLVSADVPAGSGIAVLAGYSVVYCLPCLVLLGLGAAHGGSVRRRLGAVYERIGSARTVPRSVPAALGLGLLAAGVTALAVA